MKKKDIVLSAAFMLAIASCKSEDDGWTDGKTNGRYRDTTANGNHYRYYGGFWYPIFGGRINPVAYQGATINQIAQPGFRPMRSSTFNRSSGTRSGGFGGSSHTTTSS